MKYNSHDANRVETCILLSLLELGVCRKAVPYMMAIARKNALHTIKDRGNEIMLMEYLLCQWPDL